ncbi:hypothetical protein Cni_G27998 [Canna indica]|uniref:Regulatory protein RecX n=1 Tax=Canna indica TaxID=4628 RepID=A0AAQ3L8T0_9LILI|nr:hypothetical protein Cni_G27998 [Canna indica]
MAILSAKSFQIAHHGQFRCLVISSWVKSRRQSSGPIRYIPSDYGKMGKTAKFSRIKSAKEIENDTIRTGAPGRNKFEGNCSRNSHFDSEDMSFSGIFDRNEELLEFEDSSNYSLDIMETAEENNFELSIDSIDEAQDSDVTEVTGTEKVMKNTIKQDAEKMAIDLLAARAFTAVELRRKLRGKKYPLDIVDAVITSIEDRGLLNDGLYAESFSRSRWLTSTWGPRRIKMALFQKGVSKVIADKVTKDVFEEDDTSGDSHKIHGMSKPAFERLYLQANKQWLRGQNTTLENRKARIMRWLQYRGFSWGVTNIILRKLESDHPP